MSLRVLIIGYVWPEPTSSAASGHVMQLLHTFLEQGWHLTFASAAAPGEYRADLAALGITEVSIELNDSSFDTFVSQLQPDLVLFDQFMIEEQFGWRVERCCPNALRILETSDLQSLRHARHVKLKQLLKIDKQPLDEEEFFTAKPSQLYQWMADDDLTQREIASLFRCDLSLIISEAEVELLTTCFGMSPSLLHECPLMVEPPEQSGPTFDQRAHFLSIGNFRHAPNWDAVLWMKETLWPMIRRQLPDAQLHVYGAYTPPKASALHNPQQGFHVLHRADDALRVMAQARVCLAPLRFGAGIKGKLIDAMLAGTPSVTTQIGAEGMHGELPWPGLVANDAFSLAEAAVRLYRDQTLWRHAQANGFDLLRQRYHRELHTQRLLARIEQVRERLTEHRRDNFIGAMLRHHQHKSTRYMSQWIEAKNRLAAVQRT